MKAKQQRKGFTLVETMVGVTIIGILASLSIPAFQNVRDKSNASALANNFRIYGQAFETYSLLEGKWPGDVTPSVVPSELEGQLPRFTEVVVGGNRWDWDHNARGVTAGVALRGGSLDTELMMQIDSVLDDGDLSTGRMQSFGYGLTYVLEP